MTDADAVRALTADLVALGVRTGQDLLVHSSLRQVGQVEGGATSVLGALRAAIGPNATLVVPAQTTENSFSSEAFRAAMAGLSPAELARFVATMPGFDPDTTPSSGMGVLAEHVRLTPGSSRSAHPQSSFAAIGARAAQCTAGHAMTCHLGDQSPLGWLYAAHAAVLLLGVGYAACSAFHLAEYRLPGTPTYRQYHCFTLSDGSRRQRAFTDIVLDAGDFGVLGEQIDKEPFVRRGRVGSADCRLLPIRAAVDFAIGCPEFVRRRRPVAGPAQADG